MCIHLTLNMSPDRFSDCPRTLYILSAGFCNIKLRNNKRSDIAELLMVGVSDLQ